MSTPFVLAVFLAGAALGAVVTGFFYSRYRHAVVGQAIANAIALLKAVAFGWRQESIARNAQEISDLGREMFERIRSLAEHFENVGNHLGKSVRAYNQAVESLEKRVLPQARRFQELGVGSTKAMTELHALEVAPLVLTAPEMIVPVPAAGEG